MQSSYATKLSPAFHSSNSCSGMLSLGWVQGTPFHFFRVVNLSQLLCPCKLHHICLSLSLCTATTTEYFGIKGPSGEHLPHSKANFKVAVRCSGPDQLNVSKDGEQPPWKACVSLWLLSSWRIFFHTLNLNFLCCNLHICPFIAPVGLLCPDKKSLLILLLITLRQLRTAVRCPHLYSAAPWISMLSGRQRTQKHSCFSNRHPQKVRTIERLQTS